MPAIIHQAPLKQQPNHWEAALKTLITNPRELLEYIELEEHALPWQYDTQFPLRVTRSFAARIKKGDPHDPLLKQVLSLKEESQLSNGFSSDPLNESEYNPVPGLLHKFHSQVLVTLTSSCAIHCRYCFRRHFPYSDNNPGTKGWKPILQYIAERPQINEVILSGGDPLMANDTLIQSFLERLATVSHIKVLRIHSRLPVVIPERITNTLIHTLTAQPFHTVMVYHINHPQEIVPAITERVARLKAKSLTVLNQAVLLKGVNDSASCLKALSWALFDAGIHPYYLNLLDAVQGAAHFDIPLSEAKALQAHLKAHLPGYLVPQFVKEVPGNKSKLSLECL